jgi:cell division protein FtsQ
MTDTVEQRGVFDAVAEEPRLRARRVEVRRAGRRRRRRIVAGIGAFVALIALCVGALFSPLLDVDHLDIEGVRHLDPAQVRSVSRLAAGQHLFDLDVSGAEARLDRMPWVRHATVTRRWPNTVEIRVSERRPSVVVATKDGARLVVTLDGVVAGPAESLDADLPTTIVDPAVKVKVGRPLPDEVALAIEMVGALPQDLASKATGSVVDAQGRVSVSLAGGATLVLGTGEDAAQKFLAAQSILGGAVVLGGLKRVDVSVPSAPVLDR